MTVEHEDGIYEDGKHSKNGLGRETSLAPQLPSRRKLLASIGLAGAGACMTVVGAYGANASAVVESVYSRTGPGNAPKPHPWKLSSWIDISQPPYNARPDGTYDNSAIFQQAVNDAASEGGKIYVPAGDYLVGNGFVIDKDYLTLEGTGRLVLGRHISLLADGFRCSGLRFKALNTTSQIRGIQAETALIGRSIGRITIQNCEFEHFFYATNFRGTETYPIRDVVVEGCRSTAPVGINAGHFQRTPITVAMRVTMAKMQQATIFLEVTARSKLSAFMISTIRTAPVKLKTPPRRKLSYHPTISTGSFGSTTAQLL